MRIIPTIRPAKHEDWDEFHRMDIEIFPEDSVEESGFRRHIERGGFFILALEDHIIGTLIVARFGEDEGYLGRIGVAKAYQKMGFGSLLMEYAIQWFNKQGNIKTAHLYTQDFNKTAQSLYKKFGFRRSGITWHYFVPFDSLEPTRRYVCQKIQEDEIEVVGKQFSSLPAKQIRRFLTYDEFIVLTLKNKLGEIKGVCRFTPGFPGCFPFEITTINGFDDFIYGLREFSLPEFDYSRITFTDIPELAKLCRKRGYRLHHRLYKMTVNL